MKKFQFSLRSVLKLKESMEREYKNRLSLIQAKIHSLKNDLQNLISHEEYLFAEYRKQVALGATTYDIRIYHEYFLVMKEKIMSQKEKIADAQTKENEIRENLIEIMKEKKMLETLKEKKYSEYLQELQTEEEKKIDDFISYHLSS